MLQGFISILSSAYVEIIILIVLLISFFTHRRDPRLVVSGVRMVRAMIVVAIFFYFMFIWASTVQPTLRSISIFGMFAVNLHMFYNLLLAMLERPYRDALQNLAVQPQEHDIMHHIWRHGKRFYYMRYAWSSLFSGTSPFEFLRGTATERVKDDIKDKLRSYGVSQKLITVEMMAAFLKSQIACDMTLPVDFKDVIENSIDDFAKHPWIQEQGAEFLRLVSESPEDLHFPEWMSHFESCVREYKK
jgi:hypothetical protein